MLQQLNETLVVKGRITESDKTKLPKGVLCRGVWPIANINQLNQNNRIYERDVFEKSVLKNEDIQNKMKSRTLFGHAEHPDRTQSDLQLTSHVITDSFIKEDNGVEVVYQNIDVLDTPCGRIVNTLLEADCAVGVSTRAEGDLEEREDKKTKKKYMRVIPESYRYVTTDFTADPSTYGTKPLNVVREIKQELDSGKLTNEEKVFATAILEAIEKNVEVKEAVIPNDEDNDETKVKKLTESDAGVRWKAFMKERWPSKPLDDPYAQHWLNRFKREEEWDYSDSVGREVLKELYPDRYPEIKTENENRTGTIEEFIKNELIKAGVLVECVGAKGKVTEIKEHLVTITLDNGGSVTVTGPTPVSVAPDGLVVIPNIAAMTSQLVAGDAKIDAPVQTTNNDLLEPGILDTPENKEETEEGGFESEDVKDDEKAEDKEIKDKEDENIEDDDEDKEKEMDERINESIEKLTEGKVKEEWLIDACKKIRKIGNKYGVGDTATDEEIAGEFGKLLRGGTVSDKQDYALLPLKAELKKLDRNEDYVDPDRMNAAKQITSILSGLAKKVVAQLPEKGKRKLVTEIFYSILHGLDTGFQDELVFESKCNENGVPFFDSSDSIDKLRCIRREIVEDLMSEYISLKERENLEEALEEITDLIARAKEENVDESKGVKSLYRKKGLTPPKGKGIHTKRFHKNASAIAAKQKEEGASEKDAKKSGYAIAMSKLGRDASVKKSHWSKKNESKVNEIKKGQDEVSREFTSEMGVTYRMVEEDNNVVKIFIEGSDSPILFTTGRSWTIDSPNEVAELVYYLFNEQDLIESMKKERKSKLIFESYDEMVDYLKDAFAKFTPEQVTKLSNVFPTAVLNERKSISGDKELRNTKIKEASTRASLEKAVELLTESEETTKSLLQTNRIEAKVFSDKLKESQVQESDEVEALRRCLEEKVKSIRSLTKSLQEAKIQLTETIKTNENKIIQMEKDYRVKAIKEYVGIKSKNSSLSLPSNSRALLESCSTVEEVDKVFEDVRDALRRGALLPSAVNGITVQVTENKDEKQKQIDKAVGIVFDSLI